MTLSRLFELGRRALAEAGVGPEQVSAVGISCGGPLDRDLGIICGPPGLPGWDEVFVVEAAQARFGRPAYLENDATAAALAESNWGQGQNVARLVYLTISTGIGGGLVLDGHAYRGAAGNGGEPGHIVVDWQGRLCGCGQRGCAEAYVSGPAIARRAAESLQGDKESSLRSLQHDPTVEDVVAHAAAGDPLADALWRETMAILGRVVSVVVNVWEPDLVVLGGGVTQAGSMLIEPVREAALRQAMRPAARAVDVVLTSLGPQIGVLGAAAATLDDVGGAADG
jgi:glucokinase